MFDQSPPVTNERPTTTTIKNIVYIINITMRIDDHAVATITTAILERNPGDWDNVDEDGNDLWRPAKHRKTHNQRTRRYINNIFTELGPYYVRRAYRMLAPSFWKLLALLDPYLNSMSKHHKIKGGGAKNGIISNATRLSCAIRYFAGGRPEDIGLVHGVSHCQVFISVWKIVDAVNQTEALRIKFPTEHKEQRILAAGFKTTSKAGFNCCVGAINGMLLRIEQPSLACCEIAKVGRKKFFCGRKKKFGLGLQGICDAHGRFADIEIGHPATTSDYLSFTTSDIFYKVKEEGYLAEGLCLFGDSAYVNAAYMATLFKNIRSAIKDDCNFYHSCALR